MTFLLAATAPAVTEVAARTPTDTLLFEGAVLLGVATLFVLIFRRLGLGAVLGYLIAGALVGPHGLGLVGGGESKLQIAEIGIAFLLFLVGLELHPRRLWQLRRAIFGLGLAQVVVTGLILTGLIFVTLGFSPRRRSRSACRSRCRRPRRCSPASRARGGSTRLSARRPFRSCCSRILRLFR